MLVCVPALIYDSLRKEVFEMEGKKIFRIVMAFIGVFTGAGFASGQEIMQYFTSFGLWGIAGSVVATIIFSSVGMVMLELGSHYNATTHTDVFNNITNKTISRIIDIGLMITIFGIGVVMLAGAGSNLNQQFDLPIWIGSSILGIAIILVGMLDTEKVISAISSITPFLLIFVLVISSYILLFTDYSFQELDPVARSLSSTLPQWTVSAVNYAAFNITFGASMAFVVGGEENNQKTAAIGGLIGGIGVGLLILLNNLSIFAAVEEASQYPLPMLVLAEKVHPIAGLLMSVILFVLIWSTGMSLFYSFASRLAESGTKKFNLILIGSVIIGFGLSFFGFTNLISYFYPIVGYAGILFIGVMVYGWFKKRKEIADEND